jgi:hypothetical protein
MPEPILAPVTPSDPNNPTPPVTPTGTDPTPPAGGENTPKPEETTIPKHRFDEVSTKLKQAQEERDALKKEKDEAENKRLAEEGKYKELAEKAEKEKNELQSKFTQTRIDTSVRTAALRAGAVDDEAVLALIDRSLVKVDDQGNVTGVDEAVNKLLEEKPFLVGNGKPNKLGLGTNPGGKNGLRQYKLSELQNAQFYKENEADIQKAYGEGRVTDDMNHS